MRTEATNSADSFLVSGVAAKEDNGTVSGDFMMALMAALLQQGQEMPSEVQCLPVEANQGDVPVAAKDVLVPASDSCAVFAGVPGLWMPGADAESSIQTPAANQGNELIPGLMPTGLLNNSKIVNAGAALSLAGNMEEGQTTGVEMTAEQQLVRTLPEAQAELLSGARIKAGEEGLTVNGVNGQNQDKPAIYTNDRMQGMNIQPDLKNELNSTVLNVSVEKTNLNLPKDGVQLKDSPEAVHGNSSDFPIKTEHLDQDPQGGFGSADKEFSPVPVSRVMQTEINSQDTISMNNITPRKFPSVVAPQIISAMQELGKDEQKVTVIKLKLEPQHLGEIKIRLSYVNGELNAHFHAASGLVKEAVESSLPQLRDALAQFNVNLGEATASWGQEQPGQRWQNFNGTGFSQNSTGHRSAEMTGEQQTYKDMPEQKSLDMFI